jgi:hypothetical protein
MFVDCGAPLTTGTKMIARIGRAYRARAVRFGPVASEAAGVPAKAMTVGISPTSPGKIINTDSRIDHNKSRMASRAQESITTACGRRDASPMTAALPQKVRGIAATATVGSLPFPIKRSHALSLMSRI